MKAKVEVEIKMEVRKKNRMLRKPKIERPRVMMAEKKKKTIVKGKRRKERRTKLVTGAQEMKRVPKVEVKTEVEDVGKTKRKAGTMKKKVFLALMSYEAGTSWVALRWRLRAPEGQGKRSIQTMVGGAQRGRMRTQVEVQTEVVAGTKEAGEEGTAEVKVLRMTKLPAKVNMRNEGKHQKLKQLKMRLPGIRVRGMRRNLTAKIQEAKIDLVMVLQTQPQLMKMRGIQIREN